MKWFKTSNIIDFKIENKKLYSTLTLLDENNISKQVHIHWEDTIYVTPVNDNVIELKDESNGVLIFFKKQELRDFCIERLQRKIK